MTLRIMLLGLVASLGLDAPSDSDVSCWAKAGAAWVQSQMSVDPSGPVVERQLDLAGSTDCQQALQSLEVPSLASDKEIAADGAFQAATETLAATFATDLLADHREEAPGDPAAPSLALEELAPVVGLPEGEEMGCLVVATVEAKAVACEEEAADPAEPAEAPTRLDRVSSAVRLTREAVQAWADLMQQGDDAQPTR